MQLMMHLMVTENCIWWTILKCCVWHLILKHCARRVISKHCIWHQPDARHQPDASNFPTGAWRLPEAMSEIRHSTQDFKTLRLTPARRNVSKSGVRRKISKPCVTRNFLWPCVRHAVGVQLCTNVVAFHLSADCRQRQRLFYLYSCLEQQTH